MTYSVRFAPSAELDLMEAYTWYEEQSTGLGAEFLRQIGIQEARLSRNPLLHALAYAHIRRVFLNRFPYALHPSTPISPYLATGSIAMDTQTT